MDPHNARHVGDFLRQGSWFRGLGAPIQQALLARAVLRQFDRGQVLQVEESHGPGLAAVVDGSLRLLHDVRDGAPTLLYIGGPGFWFGQAVATSGIPLVTVEARTRATVLILPPAEFVSLTQAHPGLLTAVHAVVLARLRLMFRFHAEARTLPVEARLRLRLADLADIRRDEVAGDDPGADLDLSQSELAEIVGMSRQRANACLQWLQREGLVVVARSRIHVPGPAALRASAAALDVDVTLDETAEAAERATRPVRAAAPRRR